MNLADYLEKFGNAIFEGPFGGSPDEPPELAEIRFALLDHVREKSYRSGGKKVFPFNRIRIHVRGVEESRAGLYTGRFFQQYFEREVRARLEKSDCRFPADLKVEVQVTSALPGPQQRWIAIESHSQDRPAALPRRAARLMVLEGSANLPEIPLQKGRTNIGRTVDVYRSEGLYRRNDLAFSEDTEINRTVSREHAHIVFDSGAAEYRIFNDRWYARGDDANCGIWIVRDGMSQPVHRTSRGTRLESGDEIHLGQAVLRFHVK